jgi:hypothetical protein
MTQELKYPYQHINTFIISISFRRARKLSGKLELPTNVAVQYTEPSFPRIQVAMKVDVSKDAPVSFSLEVVGLFDYIGSKKEYDKELNREFVEQRAFHMLWVYCHQVAKLVSSQMGMNPLEIRSPTEFRLSEPTQPTNKKKSGSGKRKAAKSQALRQ